MGVDTFTVVSCPGEKFFHLAGDLEHKPLWLPGLWDYLQDNLHARDMELKRSLELQKGITWRGIFSHQVLEQLRVSKLIVNFSSVINLNSRKILKCGKG